MKYVNSFGVREMQASDGQIRWGSRRKPSIGGIIFYISFLAGFSIYGLIYPTADYTTYILGLLLPISLAFIVGFSDDAYNTVPFLKFVGQLTCAILFISNGVIISISISYIFNCVVTVLWVVGMMNSINMLDNMDGIVTSTTISTLIFCLFIPSLAQNNIDFGTVLIVLASLIGFLFFNWYPSKMYMGDTGSQFLGAFIAWLTIKHVWGFRSILTEIHFEQLVAPTLLLTVPLVDTTTVTIRRIMLGKSPFIGGRDHTTHHLALLGLTDRQVVIALTAVSLISGLFFLYFLHSIQFWTTKMTIGFAIFYLIIFSGMQFLYNKAKRTQPENKKKLEAFSNISSN